MTDSTSRPPDSRSTAAWSALRYPQFRSLFFVHFILMIGTQSQLAAVNWHVWTLSNDALALGLVGLARIFPIIALALLGGVVADAMDRRQMLLRAHSLILLISGSLAFLTLSGNSTLGLLYLITAIMAGVAAFESPAWIAIVPSLVPRSELAQATRMGSLAFPITAVLGPVIAGLVIGAFGLGAAYLFTALAVLPSLVMLLRLKGVVTQVGAGRRDISLNSLFEGLRFTWSTPALRGSMLLDFFATFFSSALALLPIYADQILKVGPEGYGILHAAPSVGAILGAAIMAQYGARLRRQGEIMLWAVAVYGLATVAFGLSNTFFLSLVTLAVTGLSDSISAVIRSTMRQLLTPDRLRGRTLSINMIFYMGGPQLGEFEAGVVARLTTPQFSVLTGGIGTLIVVALMAVAVPALRQYREAPLVPPAEPPPPEIEVPGHAAPQLGSDR